MGRETSPAVAALTGVAPVNPCATAELPGNRHVIGRIAATRRAAAVHWCGHESDAGRWSAGCDDAPPDGLSSPQPADQHERPGDHGSCYQHDAV